MHQNNSNVYHKTSDVNSEKNNQTNKTQKKPLGSEVSSVDFPSISNQINAIG